MGKKESQNANEFIAEEREASRKKNDFNVAKIDRNVRLLSLVIGVFIVCIAWFGFPKKHVDTNKDKQFFSNAHAGISSEIDKAIEESNVYK